MTWWYLLRVKEKCIEFRWVENEKKADGKNWLCKQIFIKFSINYHWYASTNVNKKDRKRIEREMRKLNINLAHTHSHFSSFPSHISRTTHLIPHELPLLQFSIIVSHVTGSCWLRHIIFLPRLWRWWWYVKSVDRLKFLFLFFLLEICNIYAYMFTIY